LLSVLLKRKTDFNYLKRIWIRIFFYFLGKLVACLTDSDTSTHWRIKEKTEIRGQNTGGARTEIWRSWTNMERKHWRLASHVLNANAMVTSRWSMNTITTAKNYWK
jgi:hypothetical protein